MRTNLVNYATTRFRILSDDQIERIFLAALEVLEDTGALCYSPEALQIFKDAGAIVDGNHLRIPSGLVRQALNTVPQRIVLGDRNGKRTMHLESNRVYFGPGTDCPFILDDKTGEHRQTTIKDTADAARVVDACPNLDFHMSMCLPQDVPTYSYDCHAAVAMFRNTIKPHVFTVMSRRTLQDIVEMYYLIRGGRDAFEINPGFVAYFEPTSPLKNGKAPMEKVIFAAQRRIPFLYTPCPSLGGTAPATLAGGLVLTTAENLVGITLSQLVRAGAPLVFGGVLSHLDPRTMAYTYGSPELQLGEAGLAEIGHWLKIPTYGAAGCSDSKVFDEQAAAEAAFGILASGLSGANLIHDTGFLEGALIASHEMNVLSDELVGMAKHFMRGIRVDDETLAVDVIKEVGPGGAFVDVDHTAKHFRQEFWFPKLMDRTGYSNWQAAGSKTLGQRVHQRVRDILATHKVPPLPEEVDAGIDKILARADKQASALDTNLA